MSAIDLVERLTVLANAEGGGPTADALDEAADTITRLQAALTLIADDNSWRGFSPLAQVERMREHARSSVGGE